ncbi:MAG TPA: PIN domain-containing protein [Gaiellaceae bacterium]|nr:PIN domain-containing protein [Gaiellaceae bacterium]
MIVLDSSFLVAHHNARDAHHRAAAETMERVVAGQWGRALLLEYVLAEVATVLLVRRGLDTASRVVVTLLESREVDFVPCSDFFTESLETFTRQQAGVLSFVDAAIVVVARSSPAAVATFDDGFRRVGGITVVPG